MIQTRVSRIVESVAVGAVMASAALVALGPVPTAEQLGASIFFIVFGVFAAVLGYRTASGMSGSIGFLPFLSAVLITPNFAALAPVAISVTLAEIIAKRAPIKAAFNVAQHVFAQAMSVGVYLTLGGTSLLDSPPPLAAFLAMVAVFFVLNKLAVSTVIAASTGGNTLAHWISSMRASAAYDILAFPLILFFAFAYKEYGPVYSATLALPIFGIRQLYKTNFALQKINEELLQLMVASIEARDPYTSGHSQRVARYARVIARAAGVSAKQADRIYVAALLHDVGKIHEEFAPILRKPGKLTESEFEVMKSHPERGATLIAKVSHFEDLVPLVRAHHEAWDGTGYPAQLVGEAIPLGARIIALADTIDAMSTSRPYRPALSAADVRAEIVRVRGQQFDPRLCDSILSDKQWADLVQEMAVAIGEFPESMHVDSPLDLVSTQQFSVRIARGA